MQENGTSRCEFDGKSTETETQHDKKLPLEGKSS